MTFSQTVSNTPEISPDSYVVIGLATCFIKQEGEVHQVSVVEPIPSAALETLFLGTPTSYQFALGTTLGNVLTEGQDPKLPEGFPAEAQLCDDFVFRALAAARTYAKRPSAQTLIPQGSTYTEFNFSIERKRVLNSERIIKTEDNVKQHPHTHQVL